MIQNLEHVSGLPVALDDATLAIVASGRAQPIIPPPQMRFGEELRPFLLDSRAPVPRTHAYAMYRGVYRSETEHNRFRSAGVRYDITVIAPGRLDTEYAKTVGHRHPLKPGTDQTYPEVYEVLAGSACFLFQNAEGGPGTQVLLICAGPRATVVVPSGVGHITVNTGPQPLAIANVFADSVTSSHDFFKPTRGAAYYVLAADAAPVQPGDVAKDNLIIRKNPLCQPPASLSFGIPKETPLLGTSDGRPLYTRFLENPDRFAFLTSPEQYTRELASENLFSIQQ